MHPVADVKQQLVKFRCSGRFVFLTFTKFFFSQRRWNKRHTGSRNLPPLIWLLWMKVHIKHITSDVKHFKCQFSADARALFILNAYSGTLFPVSDEKVVCFWDNIVFFC